MKTYIISLSLLLIVTNATIPKENGLQIWTDINESSVIEYNEETHISEYIKSIPTIILFSDESDASKQALQEFKTTSIEFSPGTVQFLSIKLKNESDCRSITEHFGVNTTKLPQVMLAKCNSKKIKKYKLENADFTAKNYRKFIADFNANALTEYIKSEDIPISNDQPVKVIVGNQFEELVTNNKKDVFVHIYAPWCQYSQQLMPTWKQVAEKLANVNPNIMIAQIDFTKNEIPLSVSGFPTMIFFPGDDSEKKIEYQGGRYTENIFYWLKEHSTHPWEELNRDQKEKSHFQNKFNKFLAKKKDILID